MKPSAYLINTARGDIVHEAALVDALSAGKIKGAGLDVYEFEPEITAELIDMENVVLLPHIGSATWEARDRMSAMAADNVIAVLEGRKPPNPVPEMADP
jgi:glyoxylate reductase